MKARLRDLTRDDWIFVSGLVAILMTLVITASINGEWIVWIVAALSALVTLLFVGAASAFARSANKIAQTLELKLPETTVFSDYSSLTAELERAASRANTFIWCTGSASRDKKYLEIIEKKAYSGIEYIRIVYPDPIHPVLSQHILGLLNNEECTFLKTDEVNLPNFLITDRDMLILFPQPQSKPPLAFHIVRPDKVELLRSYFTRLVVRSQPYAII